MKLLEYTTCICIGLIFGICIGHAQAKDDFSHCWDATKHLELVERINQCVPILDKEWRKTSKGWKQ